MTIVVAQNDRISLDPKTSFTYEVELETTTGTEMMSLDSDENQGDDDSGPSVVSPDGRFAAFTSHAANLVESDPGAGQEVYLRDRDDGTTTLVSGGDDDAPEDDSADPDVSEFGDYVAFSSLDEDLDDTSLSSDGSQIFLWNREFGTTTRVSRFFPHAS